MKRKKAPPSGGAFVLYSRPGTTSKGYAKTLY